MKLFSGWAAKLAVVASILTGLTSCGGGGASADTPLNVGSLSLNPITGSIYAGVPFTFTISGGRRPYIISSSEQTLIPFAGTPVNGNQITVVANNPGVVDANLPEGSVPLRTVEITVRDSNGVLLVQEYQVVRNLMLGYGIGVSTIAACGSDENPAQSCSGGDSLVSFFPLIDGLINAGRTIRLSWLDGPYNFVNTTVQPNTLVRTVDVLTDEHGLADAQLRVDPNVPTQYAMFRATDVATGAYRDITFVIFNPSSSLLTVLPSEISLVGALTTACGTGTVNLYVFGGTPPYTAVTTFPDSIAISPAAPASLPNSGDAFTVAIFNPNFCLDPGTVIVTDSQGRQASVEITTAVGTTAPVVALTVAPTTICIPDGGSGVILVSGGNTNKVVNSANVALVTALPVASTANFPVTLTAQGVAVGTQTAAVTVSDGGSSRTVTVTRKTTCP